MPLAPKRGTDAWREALKIISRCPVCSTPYLSEDANVFAREEAASLVHISCRACQSFFVAMVVLLGAGVSSIGMVTDLNFRDASRLYSAEPIAVDDMIDGHLDIQDDHFISYIVS